MKVKLSKSFCQKVEPTSDIQVFWDTDARGLFLKVRPSGRKAFHFYARIGGKQMKQELGVYDEMLPGRAREIAQDLRSSPNPEVYEERLAKYGYISRRQTPDLDTITTREVLDRYLDEHCPTKTQKWLTLARLTIRNPKHDYFHEVLGEPFLQVEPERLRQMHQRVTRDHGPSMGNRMLTIFRAAWTWLRNENLNVRKWPECPVSLIKRNPERARGFDLEDEDLRTYWSTLQELHQKRLAGAERDPQTHNPYRTWCMALLSYIPVRPFEAMSLHWDRVERDLSKATVQIKQVRGGSKERTVYLPKQAQAILREVAAYTGKRDGWVFPTERKTSKAGRIMSLRTLYDEINELTGLNLYTYALRKILNTYAQDVAGISHEMAQRLCGHKPKGINARHYYDPRPERIKAAAQALADCMDRYYRGGPVRLVA